MNLLHIVTSVLVTVGVGVRMVADNKQGEIQSGSSTGPLVDVTWKMNEDDGKAVWVARTKYRCCCSLAADDGEASTVAGAYEGVSCVLADTSVKMAKGWQSYMKSGCGALLGEGHHSYTNEVLQKDIRKCLVPVDLLPEGFCATGFDPLTACRSCLPNYDSARDCDACLRGFDLATGCKECLPGLDPEFGCSECIDEFVWVPGSNACLPSSKIIDLTSELTDSAGLNPIESVTYYRKDRDVVYRCCCASGRRWSNGVWVDDEEVSCRLVDESKKTTMGMMKSGCGSLQGLSDGTYHSWTSSHLPTPDSERTCKVPLGELPDELLKLRSINDHLFT